MPGIGWAVKVIPDYAPICCRARSALTEGRHAVSRRPSWPAHARAEWRVWSDLKSCYLQVIYVADDPEISARVQRFLQTRSHRGARMSESAIRSSLSAPHGSLERSDADGLIEAMVRFEERYGGLTYPVLGGNNMEYGLDGS